MNSSDTERRPGALLGWTIAEALRRTCDQQLSVASQQDELRQKLCEGKLIALGSTEEADSAVSPIHSRLFERARWSNRSPDILEILDAVPTELQIVKVFPVLHAPNAADLLHNTSLSDAFLWYVAQDPEVLASSKLLKGGDRIKPTVFSKGQSPRMLADFYWQLDITADQLARQFVSSPLFFPDNPLPRASLAIREISSILSDRIGALRNLLVEGNLQAFGTSEKSGFEGPIARLQWNRAGILIDVRNGDLCEKSASNLLRRYTGIALRRTSDVAAVSFIATNDLNRPSPATKAESRARTLEKSKRECIEWIRGIMETNPTRRTRSKEDLWLEARQKWPNTLSQNAFEGARQEAIKPSGALPWGYPGPTRGRRSANRRT